MSSNTMTFTKMHEVELLKKKKATQIHYFINIGCDLVEIFSFTELTGIKIKLTQQQKSYIISGTVHSKDK